MLNAAGAHSRRARPETSHQKAVNANRRARIDGILHKQLKEQQAAVMKRRNRQLPSLYRTIKRIHALPLDYDSEDEENSWGPGGLVPNPLIEEDKEEDFGAEAVQRKKVIDRALRRLDRLEGGDGKIFSALGGGGPNKNAEKPSFREATVAGPTRRGRGGSRGGAMRSVSKGRGGARRRGSLQPVMSAPVEELEEVEEERPETLDDLDLDLLGEGKEGEEEMLDSDPDGTDDEDLTEDDFSHANPYADMKLT